MPSRLRPIPLLLVAAVAVALGCAGCTGSPDGDRASSTTRASTPPGPAHPLDGAAPATVLEAARASLTRAPLVRLRGLVGSGKDVITFDVTGRPDGQGRGWVSAGAAAGVVNLVVIGPRVYLSGDDTYNRRAAGAASVALLRGRWVAVPRGDASVRGLTRFVDRSGVASSALTLAAVPATATSPTTSSASASVSALPATVEVSKDGRQFVIRATGLTVTVSRDEATRPLSVREDRPAPRSNSALTFSYPPALTLTTPTRVVANPAPRTAASPAPSARSTTRG